MQVSQSTQNKLNPLKVIAGENVIQLSTFGGQLLSWEKAGVPILFENKNAAIKDATAAYRGGAPIIFPHFGKGTLMPMQTQVDPQHGNARKSIWEEFRSLGDNKIVMTNHQPSAGDYPVTTFGIRAEYDFSDDIEIHFEIVNSGENACPFQFAVHSYWETRDLTRTTLTGLGTQYFDNLQNLARTTDDPQGQDAHAGISAPIDRIYSQPADTMTLATSAYHLNISTQNMNAAVVWNPGGDHGLKDLQRPYFLCVESGVVYPAPVLQPGSVYNCTVRYQVVLQAPEGKSTAV